MISWKQREKKLHALPRSKNKNDRHLKLSVSKKRKSPLKKQQSLKDFRIWLIRWQLKRR
jgi:hypothetical protein